tara:strand:- start:1690 stop:2694 length:1005 start_codon:yes stop_codon:yes gene_type:complete
MDFIIKKLILILITMSFLDYFKNVNPNLQIFASDSTGININFGDSIQVKGNIKNLKDRKEMYDKEIINKIKQGRSIEEKMGKAFYGVRSFFEDDFCREIGQFSIVGTVAYPSWCNRDNGPFSIFRNPNSVVIIPLTLELNSGFKVNLIDTLKDGLKADDIGVIKGHNHNPETLAGPNFKFDQDQLVGIINRKQNLMKLYEISELGIYRNKQFDKFFQRNSSYDLVIDLIDKKAQMYGGVSFGKNKKNCSNHSKNCLIKSIHLLEYHYKKNSPEIINDKNWGYLTGELFPPHSLIEDYGSLKKIYLSRNFYLIIDINENQLSEISRVNVRKIHYE